MSKEQAFKRSLLLFVVPLIISLAAYPSMPEMMPSHFSLQGEVNDYASKLEVLFGLPAILLFGHIVSGFMLLKDPRAAMQSDKLYKLVFLILPILTVVCQVMSIVTATGSPINSTRLVMGCVALLMIAIGNYLTKSKRNYTIGLKTPWAMADDDNWDKTHRLGSKVFIAAGLVGLLGAVFNQTVLYIVFLRGLIGGNIIVFIYSYWLYKTNHKV
ncbi:SdpI family protein [Peptoniphilus equinus]|uniref:SdpI family protein n=1 Tax=Peptoniphilus equinus TaxID=3016343 RepID=A0ABY7QSL9_9FIRM|nr:SdpI family protein [Peptoniphilus equinus]WBW49792.1 SdpI family protein [Peptoniphilus equinus]